MNKRKSSRLEAARLFVAHAPCSMVLLSLEGAFLEASPQVLRFLGMGREALQGRKTTEIFPGTDEGLEGFLSELARGVEISTYEQRFELGGAGARYTRLQASYWRDEAGAPVAILVLNHEITSERQAEQRRAQSEAVLRTVIDNIPATLTVRDLETGRFTIVNTPAAVLMSETPAGCLGRTPAELMLPEIYGDMAVEIEAAGEGVQESTVPYGPAAGRVVRTTRRIFTDPAGRRQMLTVGEDITELRHAAEALERVAAEADAANQAKSEFLANMSHEIRTPINGVMGVAGALAKTPLAPAQQEMVSIIETSARTLEALLSDILDLARVEAGRMSIHPEPFDLATSVNACGALFDAAAQAKGVDLVVQIAPEAEGIYVGDPTRIRQILSNLLGNAVKFTERGRISFTVTARRDETTSELRFAVRDTGIGFDAETKSRLFSRFEQADGSITRRFGGSGLGLAISRSLAEAMGGRLEADAEPGRGAVFTLVLDLPRGEGAAEIWSACAPDAVEDPLAGLKVLLAEDHPTNRRVVELILGAAGVELHCVEDGGQAVVAFERESFDLVLMDMQMPVMDGLTAIREIRAREAAAGRGRTPIYVLTANAMAEHAHASATAGADGHISKPIVADALLETLSEAARARLKPAPASRHAA